MKQKLPNKRIIFILLLVTAISGLLIYLQKLTGIEKIRELILHSGVWGPVIYIFLHLITQIFAPIQGTPLLILALVTFGKWAVVYTYLVNLLSSFTNFWIARKLGRGVVIRLVGKDGMTKVDKIAQEEGVKALIILRFFQGFMHDFISYAAGLTSMKFSTYYLISTVVPLPWTIAWFVFFDSIPERSVFSLWLSLGALLFLIPPLYYLVKNKKR